MRKQYLPRLQAAGKRLPDSAVFSGFAAAWLPGLDVTLGERIEVTIPKAIGVTTRSGMIVRRAALAADEIVSRYGLPSTSPVRTLLDVSCRAPLTEAVVIADMALRSRLVSADDLVNALNVYAGAWGIKNLRQVVWHSEQATESQMESRLRMLLVLAGLPRPQAQVSIHDEDGTFLGRPDFYYPADRVAIEYDGAIHKTSLAEDNRRQNRLIETGIVILRFTAGDIYHNADGVIAMVRGRLRESVHTTARQVA